MAPLDTAGWAHNGSGEIMNGQTRRSPEGFRAFFKHAQELQGGDVWKMRVEGRYGLVGFATEQYNVEKHVETYKSTAGVSLPDGETSVFFAISQDGQQHRHCDHLKDHIPETLPYDVALRINKDGSLPQIQFNDDNVWHDFAPEGGTALKAGPWFPYLCLYEDDLLSDHRVDRPRATKSAGMKCKPASDPAPAPAGDGAGAAAADGDDCKPCHRAGSRRSSTCDHFEPHSCLSALIAERELRPRPFLSPARTARQPTKTRL